MEMTKGIPTRTYTYGVGQEPAGFAQEPVGFAQEPVGFAQEPVGFGQEPVGFGQEPTTNWHRTPQPLLPPRSQTSVANETLALERFRSTLPNPEETLEDILNLEFFALCPNGKRIPVKDLCVEFKENPDGLVYRSFENRLMVVIQAMFPGDKTPYWQQAFYYSSGQSSGMPRTWLPFNGILARTTAQMSEFEGPNVYRYSHGNKGNVRVSPWISKDEFTQPIPERRGMFGLLTKSKSDIVNETYILYLPEGDEPNIRYSEFKENQVFERFGAPSYVLASHALGGHFFRFEMEPREETKLSRVGAFWERVSKKSPPQECFEKIAETYPIVKAPVVNAYIDKHRATSLQNAFRQENVFPPGLAFLQAPIKSLGYSLPIELYWLALSREVKKLFSKYKTGEITIEDVKKEFANPKQKIREILKAERQYSILPDEPEYSYVFGPGTLKHYKNYLGGSKARTKKRRGKKSITRKRG